MDVIETLMEVADSGVEFEDDRLRYVTVQIDAHTWKEIKQWAKDRRAHTICSNCQGIIYPGEPHYPFNGNQMGMCEVKL